MESVIHYIANELGIKIPITNLEFIKKYISDRLNKFSTDNKGYISILNSNALEYSNLIDRVTINETYLFRESIHFDLMYKQILPLFKRICSRTIKLWSATCSTGEEAISLYYISKLIFNDNNFQVFASDINCYALEKFRSGSLSKNSFREDGNRYHHLITNKHKVDEDVISKINIENINIFQLDYLGKKEMFDVIFLRNTLIYFSQENKNKIIKSVLKRLNLGGYLILSSTETQSIRNDELELLEYNGCFYFRKIKVNKINLILKDNEPKYDVLNIEDKIDYKEVLLHSISILKDNNYYIENSNNFKMSIKVVRFFKEIDNKDYNYALQIIKQMEQNNPLTTYLEGYYYYVLGKTRTAVSKFRYVLELDNDFWPAKFYLSLILKSKTDISGCLYSIDRYINNDEIYFQVLLDGFNGNYFKKICNDWLRQG